jgi:phage tail-like protein
LADKSSYLRYLPPVLWEKEPDLPAFSVGAMLRIFEKMLTGIDDDATIRHGDHDHESVEAVIARMHRLFNPWFTPPEFLDWLASWVSLEFPAIWDDYQRRKVTTEIVQVYRRRGLKAGLNQYLDLYTVAEKRPRIAVDDGSKVLFMRPQPGRFALIHSLISQGASAHAGGLSHEGLVRPLCIALAPDGSLLVGDNGTPIAWSPIVRKSVWQLPPPGRYQFVGAPPRPQRIGPASWNLVFPVALAVDDATPWRLYVLDNVLPPGANALYELTSPGFGAATALATKATLGTIWPVAMAFDTNGHLLILDRGTPVPSGVAAAPKIIDVQISPFSVTSTNLTQVIEPLSLLVQPSGDLIIGDGREQNIAVPADLVRIDRSNPAIWLETRLLAVLSAAQNPLVAPTAVVREDTSHIFVLDLGLKAYAPPLDPALSSDPFRRNVAEPAVIYRVDLGAPAPVVTAPVVIRASETGQLVHPTGMVLDQGTLYVSDRGDYSDPGLAGELLRVWRATPHEFGVIVHFSEQRPTTQRERRQIVQNIREIVNQEKPAHTDWTMVYAV